MAHSILKYLLSPAGVCIAWISVVLAGTSPKSIVATHVVTTPRIDGYLTDEVWQTAVAVSGFQQFDPEEGAPSTEITDRKSTRLNSSHIQKSRMPSSA